MKTWSLKDSYLVIKEGKNYSWYGFGPYDGSIWGYAGLNKDLNVLVLGNWKGYGTPSNDELKRDIERSPKWNIQKTPAIIMFDMGGVTIVGDISDEVLYKLGYEYVKENSRGGEVEKAEKRKFI